MSYMWSLDADEGIRFDGERIFITYFSFLFVVYMLPTQQVPPTAP